MSCTHKSRQLVTHSRDVFTGELVRRVRDQKTRLWVRGNVAPSANSGGLWPRRGRRTLPTAPSPTTTHLIVCMALREVYDIARARSWPRRTRRKSTIRCAKTETHRQGATRTCSARVSRLDVVERTCTMATTNQGGGHSPSLYSWKEDAGTGVRNRGRSGDILIDITGEKSARTGPVHRQSCSTRTRGTSAANGPEGRGESCKRARCWRRVGEGRRRGRRMGEYSGLSGLPGAASRS